MKLEESLWKTEEYLPDVFDFFLAFDWILNHSDDRQSVMKVLNSCDSPSMELICSYYSNPMEMLLTLLIENPTHSLLQIADYLHPFPKSPSVNSELLSSAILTIYRFLATNKLTVACYESLSSLLFNV